MEESISDLFERLIAEHGFDVIYDLLKQIQEAFDGVPQETKKEYVVIHQDCIDGG